MPNTLIALHENVISRKYSRFKWSGERYEVRSWNSDQTLESAFRLSCVWCYQEIANRVGEAEYRQHLEVMSYGVLPTKIELTEFWLDGSLEPSVVDQVGFIKDLYTEAFPVDKAAYSVLKTFMLVESNSAYSLYAKTGWSPYGSNPVGCYVGYLETDIEIWFFATNLAVVEVNDFTERKNITLQALEAVGAYNRHNRQGQQGSH